MGIRYVGETVAKKLAQAYQNIEALKSASFESLLELHDIGERVANSVCKYFENPKNIELIDNLKKKGFNFENQSLLLKSEILLGKKLVVSGVFDSFSREELKVLIEVNGGNYSSSVSSKTDFLIIGGTRLLALMI